MFLYLELISSEGDNIFTSVSHLVSYFKVVILNLCKISYMMWEALHAETWTQP